MTRGLLESLILVMFFMPTLAHAHLVGGNGLFSGLTHPIFGLDHLLAMVAVGILSVQLGNRAIWAVPLTFVSVMTAGGTLGISGTTLPGMEYGIALSVVVLGLTVAISRRFPAAWAMGGVAIFAFFHGYGHGIEVPSVANPFVYSIGFVLSTAILHVSGVCVGYHATKSDCGSRLLRYAGAGIGVAGAYFLTVL